MGPFRADELFLQEDFVLLEKFITKMAAEKIHDRIKLLKIEEPQAWVLVTEEGLVNYDINSLVQYYDNASALVNWKVDFGGFVQDCGTIYALAFLH